LGEFSRGLWQWHRTDDRFSSFYYVGSVITRSLSRGSQLTLSQRARQLHWRHGRRLAIDRHLQRKVFSFARNRVTNEHQSRGDNRPIKLVKSSCQSSVACGAAPSAIASGGRFGGRWNALRQQTNGVWRIGYRLMETIGSVSQN